MQATAGRSGAHPVATIRRASQSIAFRPGFPLGSNDRSERVILLRRAVLDALERARERHDGRLSAAYESLEPHATREGLTRDDFYRAARRETVEKLSQSKLARLKVVLEQAGLVTSAAEPGAELVGAIEALSRTSLMPERLRRDLPRKMLCLRRSYLVPGAVNVSHVEITFDDLVIHYRETRAGSLGAASQRSEIRGTVLHHEDIDGVLYVLGHNEFRTSFAVEEMVSTRSNIVVLSVLRPCNPPSLSALEGIHVGVTPENNPDHPDVPYAAPQVLIETSRTLAEAARAGLVQNHPVTDLLAAPAWNDTERALLRQIDVMRRLAGGTDPRYGLFMATPPSPARTSVKRAAGQRENRRS